MAVVHFKRTIQLADGTRVPASATFRFTPVGAGGVAVRRVLEGTPDETILPQPFPASLVGGVMDVTLDPTTAGWVWRVEEYATNVAARTYYVAVPVVAEVDDADLVEVDIATLEPAVVAEPGWVAMANSTVNSGAVAGDDLILTRTDGTTVNAGNVRGAAGATGPAGPTGPQGPAGASAGITFTTLTSAGQAVTIPAGNVAGLALTQDSTGGRTVTWPTGIRWDGGTVPTLSTAAGATDVFTFILVSAGAWLGKKDGSHPAPADTTAPSAVTGLTAGTATATSIPLSWTAATDNVGIAGYEYSTNGTSYTATGSTGTTYTVTGLTASTSYTIYVRAYDAAGNRGAAASVVKSTAAAGVTPGTVITSDSFTGANTVSIGGRTTDIALGGTAKVWSSSANNFGITANELVSGTGTSANNFDTGVTNLEVSFKLVAKPTTGTTDFYLRTTATYQYSYKILVGTSTLGVTRYGPGGNVALTALAYNPQVGSTVSLKIVGSTLTMTGTDNLGAAVNRTATDTDLTTGSHFAIHNVTASNGAKFDDLVVTAR